MTKSMSKYKDTPLWNAKLNKKMWKIYLKGNALKPPIEMDLSFMPKTYIETAEFDCLHDEAVDFHNKIENSLLNETKQTIHGYDFFKKSEITKDALEKRISFLMKGKF